VSRPILLAGVTLAALLARPAQATILLFDQQRDAATGSIVGPTTSGGTLPGDYGDHVTGPVMAVPGGSFTYGDGGEGFTPDVTVDIFSAAATPTNPGAVLWQTGYGDLVNVVFSDGPGTAGAPQLSVVLSAAPGTVVRADRGGLWITAGDGLVELARAQLEGKRVMEPSDLVNGRALSLGDVLGT